MLTGQIKWNTHGKRAKYSLPFLFLWLSAKNKLSHALIRKHATPRRSITVLTQTLSFNSPPVRGQTQYKRDKLNKLISICKVFINFDSFHRSPISSSSPRHVRSISVERWSLRYERHWFAGAVKKRLTSFKGVRTTRVLVRFYALYKIIFKWEKTLSNSYKGREMQTQYKRLLCCYSELRPRL